MSYTSVYIFAVLVTVATVLGGSSPVKKRSLIELTEGVDEGDLKMKRTFCHAGRITGCPGKRDIIALKSADYDYDPQSLLDAGDDSGDVARDILAEARFLEALQARNLFKMSRFNRHQGLFPRQKRALGKSISGLISGESGRNNKKNVVEKKSNH